MAAGMPASTAFPVSLISVPVLPASAFPVSVLPRFSAACIRYCRIVVLLFVGDFVGTGILIVRADGPVAAAIVFEFDAITCFEADGRTSHFRSGCELGHVDGVRIGRTGGDIGNAARVDLSVGIGATDEDGG